MFLFGLFADIRKSSTFAMCFS
jgi:hypothetical protein